MSVVVVGGGITGLETARRIVSGGEEVLLLEGDDRIGGKILTHYAEGLIVEGGPDWFVTRSPHALALCLALGLGEDLVAPARSGALVVRDAQLVPFPEGFVRGVPTSVRAAISSGFLSLGGALRVLGDYVVPGRLHGPDVSVGAYVRRRLGPQVLERLVDPMLSASRSGSPDAVSLAAGAPELDAAARGHRSLMRGLRKAAASVPPAPSPFYGLKGGMSRLVAAVAAALPPGAVRTSAPVESIEAAGTEWEVIHSGGERVRARAVVLALPPPAAAPLVARSAPEAARLLAEISFDPAAVVALIYPHGSTGAPDEASGILVPRLQRRTITACAWYSAKWPHSSPGSGPDVMRAVAGAAVARHSDDELVAAVAADVARLTGAPDEPDRVLLTRWDRALPLLGVGHLERVARIEEALPEGLMVAGAGYRGSGLPDCLSGAEAAAGAVLGGR